MVRQEFFPHRLTLHVGLWLPLSPGAPSRFPAKARLTHWMNWASSQAWATRCVR